jgi:hypothetical protein
MAYKSIDQLQKLLGRNVFHYAKDSKKAAGRALGTLVEVIIFYLLKSWGFEQSVAIERALPEYGRPDIAHNVEYSLHPILRHQPVRLPARGSLTSSRILAQLEQAKFRVDGLGRVGNILLTGQGVLRNSCVIASGERAHLVATLDSVRGEEAQLEVVEQFSRPYAIFECKRVGVEEGMRKGPQTIEKAKQGAYVAKSLSSLQKLRTASGELRGLIFKADKSIYVKPYSELVAEIIDSTQAQLLRDFILTVGVVSNHGNWFTSENHNKELKVLAQSYDWLLFLTDDGLAQFITELLLEPSRLLEPARDAFVASYAKKKKTKNRFTKVQMDHEADQVLQDYFRSNSSRIERWFNIIGPPGGTIKMLRSELSRLRGKDWGKIHSV